MSLKVIIKHLPGKHTQQSHSPSKGSANMEYQEQAQKFADFMKADEDYASAADNVTRLRSESRKSVPFSGNKAKLAISRSKLDYARQQLPKAEAALAQAKQNLSNLKKDVKGPGFGEWTKADTGKAVIGSSAKFTHPSGELGEIRFATSPRLNMQNVAASSSVEWSWSGKTYRKSWSGSTADKSARTFMADMFGIRN